MFLVENSNICHRYVSILSNKTEFLENAKAR